MLKLFFIFFFIKKILKRKNIILFGKYWMGKVEVGVFSGNEFNLFNSLVYIGLLMIIMFD